MRRVVVSLIVLVFGLEACGSGSSGPSAGPGPGDGRGGTDQDAGPQPTTSDGGSSGSGDGASGTDATATDASSTAGPCTAGAVRCSGNDVQTCDAQGALWTLKETCTTYCASGKCALAGLDVGSDRTADGEIHVQGDVVVKAGATLSAPSGELTLFADRIVVEQGGAISAAPTGESSDGEGSPGYSQLHYGTQYTYSYHGGGGGSYGSGSKPWGSDTSSEVRRGSPGGKRVGGTAAALGGGVIRLVAKQSITIAGQVTANGASGEGVVICDGGSGGGSGGGIVLATDDLSITGSVSAVGGGGGTTGYYCGNQYAGHYGYKGGDGGDGRLRLLSGSKRSVTGTILGKKSEGLMPPLVVTAPAFADRTRIYNDGIASITFDWTKPFPSAQGSYVAFDSEKVHVPTPATGSFVSTESASFPLDDVTDGDNWFHVASVDASSSVGTIETPLLVRFNRKGPNVSSSSHPSTTDWTSNVNAHFDWAFPQGDEQVKGAHLVLDRWGNTVPTTSDAFAPTSQKQIIKSNLAPGVWVLHVVSVDHEGRLTKIAGHRRINVGADPGEGGVSGQIVDASAKPVKSATVTLNRGLYTQTTSATGTYSFAGVPAGDWEVSVSVGAATKNKTVTVTPNAVTPADLAL